MMNTLLRSISPVAIRYSTCGDWEWLPDGSLKVTVPEFGNRPYSAFLVALHEIVEAYLCKFEGITEANVSTWDINHPELDEPGDSKQAPYHKQHAVALEVEKLVCHALGLSWEAHEEWVTEAAEAVDRAHEASPTAPDSLLLGSRLWAELHLFGLRHRGKNSAGWFNEWIDAVPFETLTEETFLKSYIDENPPEWSRFFEWGVELHNSVNRRLGKDTLDVENARELWGSKLF